MIKKYEIYDGFANILDDYPIVEAKTASEAVRKFLINSKIIFTKIKRSKTNSVRISAQPFIEKNGNKYANGIKVWFEIWNKDKLLC